VIEFPEQRVDRIINDVLDLEGDRFTDDPADRGGPTRWGITEAVARANGYTGDMRTLPRDVAFGIYRRRYVIEPRFSDVMALDPSIGAELVDTGVNMGQDVAAAFLQRWLNAFTDGRRYASLKVDGNIGNITLDALRAFLRWRGPMGTTALLRGLNGSQSARYLDLTERDPSQRRFAFGWISNRVEMP
jgi:lysozyme family protein